MQEMKSELVEPIVTKMQNDYDNEYFIIKIIIILIAFCYYIPLIVCDFYYSYINCICLHQNINELSITMQNYLHGSCFIEICILFIFCICFWHFHPKKNNNNITLIIIYKCLCLFSLIWNIIGFIIFWKKFYKNNFCNKKFIVTYLLFTFIIKLMGDFVYINKFNK